MEDNRLRTQVGKFEVVINPKDNLGYFEHDYYGEDWGGGLWFDDKHLIDYDGVFELPRAVVKGIRELGYIVGKDFE